MAFNFTWYAIINPLMERKVYQVCMPDIVFAFKRFTTVPEMTGSITQTVLYNDANLPDWIDTS